MAQIVMHIRDDESGSVYKRVDLEEDKSMSYILPDRIRPEDIELIAQRVVALLRGEGMVNGN